MVVNLNLVIVILWVFDTLNFLLCIIDNRYLRAATVILFWGKKAKGLS